MMRNYLSLCLFLVISFVAGASERPNVTVDGTVVRWQPISASAINVHKADGSFITSLPGTTTSWTPEESGRYYLVATNDQPWNDWPVSIQVDVELSGGDPSQSYPLVVIQSGDQLHWELPSYPHSMNVHLNDGTYLLTLPTGSTSWTPTNPGSYYLVASTPSDWMSWQRSNTVNYADENTTTDSPNDFQIQVNGNAITWATTAGVSSFNIHATELNGVSSDGSDYVTTIPGASTSWQPDDVGHYFIQAVIGNDWKNWQRSNLVEFVFESNDQDSGACRVENSLFLDHPNGLTFCVDTTSRNFSAINPDGTIWWELNLPGNNANNKIEAVIAVGDGVALIADKSPASNEELHYLENDRYEMSLFEAGGLFVYTRDLLPVPDTQEYVALCQHMNDCLNHTSSHRLRRADQTDWQLQRIESIGGVASSSAINGDRLDLLLSNLIEFAGRDHIDRVESAYLSFRSAVNNNLTLVESPTSEELSAAYNSVRPTWTSSPTADLLYRCPNNGTLLLLRASNPVATSLRDCAYESQRVDGSYARSFAHRTDASFFEQLSMSDGDQTVTLTGGYTGGFGYPFNSRGYSTSEYRRVRSDYTLTATNLHSSWYGGSSSGGGQGISGYTGTTSDGRAGRINITGNTQAEREFSFEMTDTRLDNQIITTEASLSRELEFYEFVLDDGTKLSDQNISLTLMSPSGSMLPPTNYRLRSTDGPIEHWMNGGVTMHAADSSRLVITPTSREDSPLGEYQLFAAGSDVPVLSGYLNLQSIFVGFGR